MKASELISSRRYAEALAELRRDLANDPEDLAVMEGMAKVLRATGEYREALVFFERLAAHGEADSEANVMAPGSAAWQIDIACLHWLLKDRSTALRLMHWLVVGILDGSKKYGDAAGGISQGLLLYYMAITDNNAEETSFALDYLRNRLKRSFSQIWPCAIAMYHLGSVAFETVMDAVNHQPTVVGGLDTATAELGRRRRLCVALFHDGVRSRASGHEKHCLVRMRECSQLVNPLIEQEWYLARHEIYKAGESG